MKKKIIAVAVILLLLAGAAAGWMYYKNTYLVMNGQHYRRDLTELNLQGQSLPASEDLTQFTQLKQLDLRGTGLSVRQYEQLRQLLPECEILWELPFADGYLPLDTREIVLEQITEEQLELLPYLTALESVDATACTDPEAVMELKNRFPALKVSYQVEVNGQMLPHDVTKITVENGDPEDLMNKLRYLPSVTDVTFAGSVPENEAIYGLKQAYPEITFHWPFTFLGLEVTSDTAEMDLSGIRMENVEELEAGLKYFNNLEKIVMCDTGLPSSVIDDLWKRHPETRFVWNVKIGKFWVRTDITYLMPFQYGYNGTKGIQLRDRDCREMKYLVDLVCIDFGHMGITDCSFLAYMPNMEYLILSDTMVSDISAMENLKKLKFFEAFKCNIRDITPLLGCTALEDVNLCNNLIKDISVLGQIETLNNIWISGINWPQDQKDALEAAKPDAKIVYWQNWGSTGRGWRYLKNYYDHRDFMDMFYLTDEGEAYWERREYDGK